MWKEKYIIKDPFFVQFLYELTNREDDFYERDIIISKYYGDYSDCCGVVITVKGSPPKATIFLPLDSYPIYALIKSRNSNTVEDELLERLLGFLKRHDIDEKIKIYL